MWWSSVGSQGRRHLHRGNKVAGQKIREQVSQRRCATELGGGNPSIDLTPFPTGRGSNAEPFPQIRGGHRISVNTDVLREETTEGLQTAAFEIAVKIFKCSNEQGKTYDESHRRFGMAVDESGHVVELALAKKEHVTACGEKGLDATQQPGDVRRRLVADKRRNSQAEKTGGRRVPFAHLIPKLLNSGSQQARVNLRVRLIHVAEVSRRKYDG